MKKVLIVFVSILFMNFTYQKGNDDNNIELKIKELLSKMTLEEKVGQMTQITLEVIQEERGGNHNDSKVDIEKLREAILKYHIGSILNTGGAANSIEGWQKIINSIQKIAMEESRLKIPVIYGVDAIHGANYIRRGTLFPQSIAMAATRNVELMEQAAAVTAREIRASGVPWDFNPVLGVGRNPLWPRFFETFGEDVYLVSEMGKAYVRGLQGSDMSRNDRTVSCLKHYLGYSFPLNGQDRTPSWIPERMLRELFLVPFAEAVKTGAMTVMVSSGEMNGIPTHSDYHVLTEILKNELGFKGFVVSDWEDIKRLYSRDRVASSPKEAVKMAVLAGLDMSMVPYDYSFYNYLLELVKEGEVPVSRIDDAVSRILRVKYLLGLFNNPFADEKLKNRIGTEESRSLSLEAAREAITLLKNEKVLPLSKNSKVLVTGPAADLMQVMNGGWSYTWQGNDETLYPSEKHTLLEAIEAKIGKESVVYVEGAGFEKEINIQKAVEAAENVDFIIAAVGEKTYCETPGNIKDLRLDEAQRKLVKELSKTGKPIILILFEGRPRVINDIVDLSSGIIMAYLPGNEGGDAIADIIFGDYNPNGKLPFTYPRYPNGFTTYDHKPIEEFDVNKYEPQFEFGFGLSYSTFVYSELKLNKNEYKEGENISVSVKVTNKGDLAGKETVELYLTDIIGSITRPVRQLKRFKKVFLKPGEEKIVDFTLTDDDLSFVGRDNKRIVEAGEFIITIANQKVKFVLK